MEKDKSLSFMRSLCMGEIEEDILFPYPEMKAEEKDTLRGVIDAVSSLLKDKDEEFRKWDKEGHLPDEFLAEMKNFGLFGFIIPEEYGGMGLSATGYSRALQELSVYDPSVAITAGAHSSIGMRGLLLFGTDDQKKKYLNKLATGEMIAAFCLTEPGAGSDAASIRCKATLDGEHWVLNGDKLWITNGGIADFFTVFARTDTNEGQITAFIVTREMGGVTHGPHEDKMGLRASSTTTITLDHVRVPKDHVLGPVGKGFKVAMSILNSGRTGLGGGCIGGMKKMIHYSTKQANERVQFGKPIKEFGLIKQKIGHMVVECYATESVVNMVAGLVDQKYEDYSVEAAISKVFASECLWRTVDEALQIAGGNGFMREFPYERLMRDCRINRIFEGTNEILRLFIALTAMNDVGKQLKDLNHSLEGIFKDPIKGFGTFSDYAKKHLALKAGVGNKKGNFSKINPAIASYAQIAESATKELAIFADKLLRKHGKEIINKQFATKRMADIMIDLFVLCCVISRVDRSIEINGVEKAEKEIEILKVFSGQCNRRIRGNLSKLDDNDDDLIKSLADHALSIEKFAWDNL